MTAAQHSTHSTVQRGATQPIQHGVPYWHSAEWHRAVTQHILTGVHWQSREWCVGHLH
jgi:hypothetical protein